MSDRTFTIRLRARWLRLALVVVVTAAVVAPVTAWASHTFTDVPEANTFHNDIEWLKQSGVTFGCNPPDNTQYCPNDPVTRAQMAAFMRRLAENQVVDAATVQGRDTGALALDFEWVTADVSVLVPPTGEGSGQADCPAGKYVVSGGSQENSSDFVLTDSEPLADLSGWKATYENFGGESTLEAKVYALCASYTSLSTLSLGEAPIDPNH